MNKIACIIAVILVLASGTTARADVAPPEPAPGSDINPGQETKVRMVAENVLMVVKKVLPDVYVLEVNADFAMRNLGQTEEKMQARFPLENISGFGDGWTDLPTEVRNFRVSINKSQVSTKTVEQPYHSSDIPINWAVFDVTFPTNQDIFVHVSYETDIQNYESPSFIEYILGTGEGWHDSIGSATITLRFPYAVSLTNVLWFDSQTNEISGNPVLVGKEIRWHWDNYEPDIHETVRVAVINPVQWQSILDLEAKTGNDPNDIDGVIELSRKYRSAGSNKDPYTTLDLVNLSEIVLQQAIALHPNNLRLHLELAEIYYQRYQLAQYLSEEQNTERLQHELEVILALEPANQRALEIKVKLQQDMAKLLSPTSAILVTETIPKEATETPTPEPINTSLPMATATINAEMITNEKSFGMQIVTGLIVLVVGFITGTIFAKKRKTPS